MKNENNYDHEYSQKLRDELPKLRKWSLIVTHITLIAMFFEIDIESSYIFGIKFSGMSYQTFVLLICVFSTYHYINFLSATIETRALKLLRKSSPWNDYHVHPYPENRIVFEKLPNPPNNDLEKYVSAIKQAFIDIQIITKTQLDSLDESIEVGHMESRYHERYKTNIKVDERERIINSMLKSVASETQRKFDLFQETFNEPARLVSATTDAVNEEIKTIEARYQEVYKKWENTLDETNNIINDHFKYKWYFLSLRKGASIGYRIRHELFTVIYPLLAGAIIWPIYLFTQWDQIIKWFAEHINCLC